MIKNFKARINGGFPVGGLHGHTWSIDIVDHTSGVLVASFEMPIETMGLVLAARQHIEAEGTVYDTFEIVGKVCEQKTAWVPLASDRPHKPAEFDAWQDGIRAAVAPHEVDGWEARIPHPQSLSQGQIVGSGINRTIAVHLTRYVAPSPVTQQKAGEGL